MRTDKHYNFIIVGQGLAGTVLGFSLRQRGYRVFHIDKGHDSAASKVAAGMWNPIVFRRLNKSWRADDLIPIANRFYTKMEDELGTKLRHEKKIARVFPDPESANDFHIRSAEAGFGQYLKTNPLEDVDNQFSFEHGYGVVDQAGYVDLGKLLSNYRNILSDSESILEETLDFDKLEISENLVTYKELKAENLIFCEGHTGTENPFFNYLPLHKNKGELLTVRIPGLEHKSIVNNGQFLLPIGNDLYRVGATYEWKSADLNTSTPAREKLLSKLREVIDLPIEVVDHKAGIRPTTQDRRPLIGFHPEHKTLGIFNGLGTKGVMIAPFFAEHFADFYEGKTSLDHEVDIGRFAK